MSGLSPTAAAGETSNIENIEPLLAIFAKSLVSWNYEDEDGNPVGTSLEELQRQDMRMLMPVVMTWIGEVSTIPDPLPKPSTGGEVTEPMGSIPMEALPANP